MTEESTKALRHRAEQLSLLAGVEAFRVLITETGKKKSRMVEALMQRVLAGESLESIQRQVDYDRGWIDGMKYAVEGIPSGAARKLQQLDQGVDEPEPEQDIWSYDEGDGQT